MALKTPRKTAMKTICLLAIACGMFAVFTFLFYSQIAAKDGSYPSDIAAHIGLAVKGKGYSFLYRIMQVLYKVTGTKLSIVLLESAMMVGTWLFAAGFINMLYERKNYFTSALIALPSLFVTGVYIPGIYEFFYRQQLVAQPYHNITYIGMRVFALPAMLVFYKVFESYLQKIKWHEWLLLAATLALSTAIKPSFFYGFALTLLLFLIFDFFKTRCRLKPFWKMVILGCVVFPSLFIMAMQATRLFGKTAAQGGAGIALVWGANFIKLGFWPTLLKVLSSLTFPALVGAFGFRRFKRTERFVYVMYGVELAISMIFVETGVRATHGNFYWGLYGGAFFLFLVAFGRYMDDLKHYKERNKVYLVIGGLLMLAHILSGLAYLIGIVQGKHFYM